MRNGVWRARSANRALIRAGDLAAREILQSDGDIANRELALVQARNGLTAANFALIDILDLESSLQPFPCSLFQPVDLSFLTVWLEPEEDVDRLEIRVRTRFVQKCTPTTQDADVLLDRDEGDAQLRERIKEGDDLTQ